MKDWRDKLIVKSTPPPKHNKYLRQLYRVLEQAGWAMTTRGGPDAFAFRKHADGTLGFMAVQAVRRRGYKLRRHQRAVLEALARSGTNVYRFNCDDGTFEEITLKAPAGVISPGEGR